MMNSSFIKENNIVTGISCNSKKYTIKNLLFKTLTFYVCYSRHHNKTYCFILWGDFQKRSPTLGTLHGVCCHCIKHTLYQFYPLQCGKLVYFLQSWCWTERDYLRWVTIRPVTIWFVWKMFCWAMILIKNHQMWTSNFASIACQTCGHTVSCFHNTWAFCCLNII